MIYNSLCGENISRLGMGNMRLPEKFGEGRPVIDFEKAQEIIDYAMANGINYFDTAYVYHGGDSEKFLGKALKNYPRESYKLATKFNYGANPDYKKVLQEQLEYLQTDYIDFYLLHGLGIGGNWNDFRDCGCIDYFMEMKEKGVIRHLGFSFHGTVDCLREIVAHHNWDFCQLQMNYYDWLYADTQKEYEIVTEAGLPVVSIGKINDIFAGCDITDVLPGHDNAQSQDSLYKALDSFDRGLIFANFVDFDMVYGHRNNVEGYAAALEAFDAGLPAALDKLGPEDVLAVTADHGNDPTTMGTDHNREYVPLLLVGPRVRPVPLGVRASFADLGQTAAEYLGAAPLPAGESFLKDILQEV